LAPLLLLRQQNTSKTLNMSEAGFGLVILIGAWVFFITARPFRHGESSPNAEPSQKPMGSRLESAADTWNCDLPLTTESLPPGSVT
jgi:hypothetical protein